MGSGDDGDGNGDDLIEKPHSRAWRNLSEDELLRVEFTASDPESLEHLSEELPPSDEEPM